MTDHGYDKEAIGKRLRRIEGQVRGIEKMVDEERYCIDILTQLGAAMTFSSLFVVSNSLRLRRFRSLRR